MFGLQLLDPLDKVALLQAAVALLVPIVEDLLEVPHLQLLQVDGVQVDLLLVPQFANLRVLLLQLLADLVRGHGPAHGLRHLSQCAGGRLLQTAQVVALKRGGN